MNEDNYMQIQQEIYDLMSQLTSGASDIGDWKILKYQEYALVGLDAPFDLTKLHIKRQAVRDRINVLREQLEQIK